MATLQATTINRIRAFGVSYILPMNTNDEIYIATLKEQINGGMYDHLFKGKHDLVFLDIGANIGLVSIYAVPYCKRIVAVEPSPGTFRQLKENTQHYSMIECYDLALAPVNGDVEFFVNDINFTASSTVNTYGHRIEVKGWELSKILDYHRLEHVDVAKIDAEGSEGESLTFQQLEAAKDIIDTYFIETHNCPKTSWNHKLGTLVAYLSQLGYTEMSISGMAITATRP